MGGDQALFAVPLVSVGIAGIDPTAAAEREDVKTGINGGIEVNLDGS